MDSFNGEKLKRDISLCFDPLALLRNGRYTAELRRQGVTFWPTDSLFYMAPITCCGACVYVCAVFAHVCNHPK